MNNKEQLIIFCKDIENKLGISAEPIYKYAIQSLLYYKNSKIKRYEYREFQSLENKWYESLKIGKPDYSVYNEEIYLGDVWACWQIYSKNYLRNINRLLKDKLININTIVDLGNGLGFTSLELQKMFPSATVIGTNIQDSVQWKYCKSNGIKMVDNINDINGKVDLLFASEYFEHWYKPVEHLEDILIKLKPRYLLIANSFGSISLGHFPIYETNNIKVDNKNIGKLFNNKLREYGYKSIKTGLWNNRPNFWINENIKNY